MVKYKFFVHCTGYKNGGYFNTHFAYDEAHAKRLIEESNERYKGTEYHVTLVSVTEITDEEFVEDYIPMF